MSTLLGVWGLGPQDACDRSLHPRTRMGVMINNDRNSLFNDNDSCGLALGTVSVLGAPSTSLNPPQALRCRPSYYSHFINGKTEACRDVIGDEEGWGLDSVSPRCFKRLSCLLTAWPLEGSWVSLWPTW